MSAERHKNRRIGRYELQALIGEGGMGNVYRGLDTKTGRAIAIKVVNLPDDADLADKLRLRFMREVLAVSRVGHPNVVRVHDYGFDDDNTPYLVMELLDGTDLGKVLRSSREPLPISYAVDMALEVCAAVRACHAAKVVHRDLKPGNVFLAKIDAGPGWQVKVLDFGVAKSPIFGGVLTKLGQIVGTLQYVSPEQVNGTAGPESDQYAIGVILYACLTKRLPFGGLKDIALLKAISRGDFLPPRTHRPELPEALESIVVRAMSVAPAGRFESVYALGQQLWPFASRLGRNRWERYYGGDPVAAVGGATTTTWSQSGTVVAPVEHEPAPTPSDGMTEIARYDATTVIGVDTGALIASVPTQILTGPSADVSPSPKERAVAAPSENVAATELLPPAGPRGARWRIFLAVGLLALLFVGLAGLMRTHVRHTTESIRSPAPQATALKGSAKIESNHEPGDLSAGVAVHAEARTSTDTPDTHPPKQERRKVQRTPHLRTRRASQLDKPANEPERDANGIPILP